MTFSIREAARADIEDVVALYEASGLDAPGSHSPATLDAAWRRLHETSARVLIAFDPDVSIDGAAVARPVGTLTLFVLPLLAHGGAPAALVEGVAVHPAAQGRGIGRALMQHALTLARAAGCYKLALSSNERREAAHAFYEHLGFERHGVSFVVGLTTMRHD